MLGSRRGGGFSETDRSLPGETSDDIEVLAGGAGAGVAIVTSASGARPRARAR
jgi:hypothetical protein